jgi:hypothetical protein
MHVPIRLSLSDKFICHLAVFFLKKNQPIILSIMAYQLNEQSDGTSP